MNKRSIHLTLHEAAGRLTIEQRATIHEVAAELARFDGELIWDTAQTAVIKAHRKYRDDRPDKSTDKFGLRFVGLKWFFYQPKLHDRPHHEIVVTTKEPVKVATITQELAKEEE